MSFQTCNTKEESIF